MADELLHKKRSFSGEQDAATAGEDELQKLECEVKRMAEEILERRSTLSDHLNTTLASLLALHRPILPQFSPSDASELGTSKRKKLSGNEDPETAKKVQLLKEKISSNARVMPDVLKRMKGCIARIDKLDSNNVTIHPAFKRKKI